MNKDIVINLNNVSKKFSRKTRYVMLYGFKDIIKDFFSVKSKNDILRPGEFFAVKNISFELHKGEVLGIIGVNGSGKSTILKMVNGIFMPDDGYIEVKGKTGALIEIGAGFHPMLTGRENIYVNGSILGMAKKEIDYKFNQIVNFSGLNDFIDTPVKFYSSGMFVRLGFAIAVFCDPDILLIDEILSVGDISFQNKAFKRLYEMKKKTNGIIYVGHNMIHIKNMCDRVLVIDHGKKLFIGNTPDGIKFYQDFISRAGAKTAEKNKGKSFERRFFSNYANEEIEILNFGLMDKHNKTNNAFKEHDSIMQYCDFEVKKEISELEFVFGISDELDRFNFLVSSNRNDNFIVKNMKPGKYRIILKYADPQLSANIYSMNLSIRNTVTGETYERIISSYGFCVVGGLKDMGVISTKKSWDFLKI